MSDHRWPPDTGYAPDLPAERVEQIRRWHEEGLRAARAEAGADGQTFDYLGLSLYVPPQVQPIYPVSRLLGEAVLREFDVVIFDPPFRWFRPRDLLEMATADPGYRALTRFVRQARPYLSNRARLLMFFGSSGDLGYLRRLVAEEGFETELLARETRVEDGWQVEYVTYRLTP